MFQAAGKGKFDGRVQGSGARVQGERMEQQTAESSGQKAATQPRSVGEAFPLEQARCRELLKEYRELPNGAGWFGAAMIEQALQRADQAAISGDVVQILQSYEELKNLE